MKNLMKKFFLFLTLAVAACGFAACSDDDDNGGVGNADNLIGRWTLVKEVWTYDGGEKEVDVYEPGEEGFLFFDEDGTGYDRSDSWTDYFEYMLSGNQLTIYYEDDEEFVHAIISSLSASKLVMIVDDSDEYGYAKGELHFERY